jgi:hypothetical protein
MVQVTSTIGLIFHLKSHFHWISIEVNISILLGTEKEISVRTDKFKRIILRIFVTVGW